MSEGEAFTTSLTAISWPDGIDDEYFLAHYWQQKPLLIRQAFPSFVTPLSADELAGLSLEADANARIIKRENDEQYKLEHGPFDENRFAALTDNQWSLLVSDVEKLIPEFSAYLQPFRFIPDWRIDDLMISYAPDGASVGAHIDEYDVFLLQGSGVRHWAIDTRVDVEHQTASEGDLKILSNFHASENWELMAGDMLYLPPGMPHHGVAKGDNCTTWSVGFRAPYLPEFVAHMAELISEQMTPARYTDGHMARARHGEISIASIQKFKSVWQQATQLNDTEFAKLLGRWLTEPSVSTQLASGDDALHVISDNKDRLTLQKSPYSRLAWIEQSTEEALLFFNGAALPCSNVFAINICGHQEITLKVTELEQRDKQALQTLLDTGCLLAEKH